VAFYVSIGLIHSVALQPYQHAYTHVRNYLLMQFDLQSAKSPLVVIYEGDCIKPEFQVEPGYSEQRNVDSIPPSNPVSRPCTLY